MLSGKWTSALRRLVAISVCCAGAASAQQARQAPAYDKAQTRTVLNRSVFYLPLFGAVYKEKFVALVAREPGVRGVIIHNHGCGGMWGWETTIAQFYYREGFAVVSPEFVTRDGNKTGCPGGSPSPAASVAAPTGAAGRV